MNSKLNKKLQALVKAENEVIVELEQLYPKGKNINVFIMSGQRYPSGCTVIGYDGGRYGYVRVRLHTGKQSIKSITPDNILNA